MWILLVLIYGTLKGIRDIAKKKALETNSVVEVLLVYTALSFLFTVPMAGTVTGVPAKEMLLIAVKSFVIFIAFLFSFYAIKKMPVSLYGVIDLSRLLFSMTLGIVVLHETLHSNQIIAMILVAGGLLMLKYKPKSQRADGGTEDRVATIIYIMAFASTFLNAISGTLDKVLMSTGNVKSGQLQFWYTFFMLVYYGLYALVTKAHINWKSVLKNPYVWVISILFVVADRCLFVANSYPESRVTVMTLLKQACCIVTIAGGKFIFKEKNTLQRLICALVIISGIVIATVTG